MAELLTEQGIGQPSLGINLTGQTVVFGGGGTWRPFEPPDSAQNVHEPIAHMAVVPIMHARNDSAVPERYSSNDSIGLPNQPVFGGDPAPSGLTMAGMFDPQLASGRSHPLPYTPSPASTSVVDPLGQLRF